MPLSLNQKLKLSQRPNYLTLFNDKTFVKAYNESAYLLQAILNKQLAPLIYKEKYKPYTLVVMVSLPQKSLPRYLPNLTVTEFGYEQLGEFDLSDYADWLTQQFKAYLVLLKKAH